MRRTREPTPPTGLARLAFRLPILLYRWRLGWVLGHRFVLINHIGRTSGRRRRVVVEVVAHDDAPESWTVASGFGPQADWYRNLLATPDVTIRVGGRAVAVSARPLADDDGARVMAAYAAKHPATARRLAGLMGYEVDGSTEDFRALGRAIPFVRLARRTDAAG